MRGELGRNLRGELGRSKERVNLGIEGKGIGAAGQVEVGAEIKVGNREEVITDDRKIEKIEIVFLETWKSWSYCSISNPYPFLSS